MKHIIKHGKTQPSTKDLDPFQLGWCTTSKKLYINDDGKIRTISSTVQLGDNTAISSKGIALNKNDTFFLNVATEDFLSITASFDFSKSIFNIDIRPTDNREFTLSGAIAHQEYNSSTGYKSSQAFTTLTSTGLNFDIGNFSQAVDKNLFFELFFTIREYDYKVEFRSSELDETSVSAICTISRTIAQ